MTKEFKQFSIGKENLYYFYRFVILPWEIDWSKKKFILSEGELAEFCQSQNLSIKSFDSVAKLKDAISDRFESEASVSKGIIWFVRKDTKPKDLLRQLRNCFAHGSFAKRQKNKINCICFENLDGNNLKAKGILPIGMLHGLIRVAGSCRVY